MAIRELLEAFLASFGLGSEHMSVIVYESLRGLKIRALTQIVFGDSACEAN